MEYKLQLKIERSLSDRMSPSMSKAIMDNIIKYEYSPDKENWEAVQDIKIWQSTIAELINEVNPDILVENNIPSIEDYLNALRQGTNEILKIKIEEKERIFEAFVRMYALEPDNHTISTLSIVGTATACRAIHSALYEKRDSEIVIFNERSGQKNYYKSSAKYRRFEEFNDSICNLMLLPRMAITKEYRFECLEADRKKMDHPDRILFCKDGNVENLIGNFIADNYSLPKTADWSNKYIKLLPASNFIKHKVIHSEISNMKELCIYTVKSMKEDYVLDVINQAIFDGDLITRTELGKDSVVTAGMTAEDYLRQNSKQIANKIDKHMKPLYDGKFFIDSIATTLRVSLPAQARAVMACYLLIKEYNDAFMIGDMGTGKTQISLTLAYILMLERIKSGATDGISVLLVAPSITIPKWAVEQIPVILGKSHIITIIESTEDATAYATKVKSGYKVPKGIIEFVLVSSDRMKLTSNKFVFSGVWNANRGIWKCPDCGSPLNSPKTKKKEQDVYATWKDVVESPAIAPTEKQLKKARSMQSLDVNNLPLNYVKRYTDHIRQFMCTCQISGNNKKHASLSRPALKERGEDNRKRRWMIAEIFHRLLKKHFYLGIFDELQDFKASDSGRGMAFHKIIQSTKAQVFLTGTLTNGTSTSIQATLWRTSPQKLIEEGFDHNSSKELFAEKYGVVEKITYKSENDGIIGRTTNRIADRVVVKEQAGIAPQLVSKHLLHKSVFLELGDLGLPLVPLKEEPIIMMLDPEHDEAYQALHQKLYETAMDLQSDIGSKAWASFSPTVLNYAAQPHLGAEVIFYDDANRILSVVTAEAFPEDYETSLERRLVKEVKQELAEDRGCIIYTYYTGKYKTNVRIQALLQKHGIDSEILDVNTTTNVGRFEWLEKQHQKGKKVLIMSMALVQVGLDLLHWPTLIYWQLHDNENVLRQSGRRAWRIGQDRECRIKYFVSEKTYHMTQFRRLMSKRISAMIVEGRIERSSHLAKFAGNESTSLTRDLAIELSAAELTETWKSAAESDIDQSLNIIEEKDYKTAIKKAFEVLTAETKRLCGITEDLELSASNVNSEAFSEEQITDMFTEQIGFNEIALVIDELKKKKKKGEGEFIEQFAFDF